MQERNFNLNLTEKEVNLLLSILVTTTGLNYQTLHPFIQKINGQLNDQIQATTYVPNTGGKILEGEGSPQ